MKKIVGISFICILIDQIIKLIISNSINVFMLSSGAMSIISITSSESSSNSTLILNSFLYIAQINRLFYLVM